MDQQQSKKSIKMSSTTIWLTFVVIIVILGIGVYFFFIQEEETNTNINILKNVNSVVNENINRTANINTTVDTSDWLTYENEEWGFRILYPPDWVKSTYGQMINLSPADKEFSYEGGIAYPIYFTFKNESASDYLQEIEDNKQTSVKMGSVDASLIDGYFSTFYYVVDIPKKNGSLLINDHITELQAAGNYNDSYASELRTIFETMLNTFVLL